MWQVYRNDANRGYPVVAVVETQAEAIEIAKAYTEKGDGTEYTVELLSEEEVSDTVNLLLTDAEVEALLALLTDAEVEALLALL
jgi:hypothetical protein